MRQDENSDQKERKPSPIAQITLFLELWQQNKLKFKEKFQIQLDKSPNQDVHKGEFSGVSNFTPNASKLETPPI